MDNRLGRSWYRRLDAPVRFFYPDAEYILISEDDLFHRGMPDGYERVDPSEAAWIVRTCHQHGPVWILRELAQKASFGST